MKIQINETTKRYELLDGTKLIKAYVSRKDLQNYIDQNGIEVTEEVSYESVSYDTPTFGINKRFEFVSQLSEMVINSKIPSMLTSGSAGIGKSHGIFESLKKYNKVENEDYIVLKGGNITSRGLFNTIRDNNREGFTIIIDDADSVLSPANSLILKGACDSDGKRLITWTTMDETETVEVKSSIIIITNLPKNRIDSAVLSRSFYVNLELTPDEMIERMEYLLPNLGNIELYKKQECLDLLSEYKEVATELNIRTLLKLFAIREAGGELWEDLATYSIVN